MAETQNTIGGRFIVGGRLVNSDGEPVTDGGVSVKEDETEADLMKLTKAELLERAGDSVTEDNNKSEIVAKLLSK